MRSKKRVQKKNFSNQFTFTYNSYTYNISVITKLFNSGFIELKGGYKL